MAKDKEVKKEQKTRVYRSIDERIAKSQEKLDKYQRLAKQEEERLEKLKYKKEHPAVGRGKSIRLSNETLMLLQNEGISDVGEYIMGLIEKDKTGKSAEN